MGVVIDAGSSHSEAKIFQWVEPKTNGTGKAVEVKTVGSNMKGISSLTPEETYAEYRRILAEVQDYIANYTSDKAVAYMSATGGMRLLK